MADVEWIKITTDIFDNRKIKQIEKLPEGDSLIVIWVKILCLAANVNDSGLIYFTKDIPYTDELLATEFNRDINTVRLALTTFEKFGMIELINDVICVSNWEKYQNIEGLEKVREQARIRKQRQRERQKIALLEESSHVTSRDSHATDKNKNKNRIDIKKENIKEKSTNKFVPPSIEDVKAYCSERNNGIDAEYFVDYYEARNWELKKGQKVKDWRACVRTWEKRSFNSNVTKATIEINPKQREGMNDVVDWGNM